MAFITEIKILNFRSYKDSKNIISNLSNINMFTGKNNSGKTNVLRALNIFFNPDYYNPNTDQNMMKIITGGNSKFPAINVKIIDFDTFGDKGEFIIQLNLNREKEKYSLIGKNKFEKLDSSAKIKKYLSNKFKCVYLSTTDESIMEQAYSLVNDMILQYYKKKNKIIKTSIEDFEKNYKQLLNTFKSNITELQGDLNKQFDIFKKSEIDIKPKLVFGEQKDLTDFLLENIRLEIDDSYSQSINVKGAGIQRTSIVLLTFFLMNEIYGNKNKIILLDEPEAFLYPLLVKELKNAIELTALEQKECQIFMTSHSREFLAEINNTKYRFYNIEQKLESKSYKRSKNEIDINKYSSIKLFDSATKYNVLKNYGLLDEIDDHENIIICEGQTDRNYIVKILENKEFRPQIRYSQYTDNYNTIEKDENKKYFPSGAQSIIPILLYLDRVSEINRKIFVLLDGDKEGQDVKKKITKLKFKHLSLKIFILPEDKEIEDMIFDDDTFIKRVLDISPEILNNKESFTKVINNEGDTSLIVRTEKFIDLFNINEDISRIKNFLSNNIESSSINKDWLIEELNPLFYV
ncbi:ATP-dependent nuclease [Macrococcus animalis]|uniref:ATP-dependent nuclease n=1 Tax=Macrococcus animalis TaxID=3395467 RepID=UPI0039BE58D2